MTHVEHIESTCIPGSDAVDAIVDLATEIRATAIAGDARRVALRLEDARFFVAIVGDSVSVRPLVERVLGDIGIPLDGQQSIAARFCRRQYARVTFRDGSRRTVPLDPSKQLPRANIATLEVFADSPLLATGVCIAVGPPSIGRWYPRLDLILTTESLANEAESLWQEVPRITVDVHPRGVHDAVSLLLQRAVESGAVRVEAHADLHHRHFCLRLGNHLLEHHRALARSRASSLARINFLSIARERAESALAARRRKPDTTREALASWLSVERTKFLMGTKADALMALEERLANQPRHQRRGTTADASHAIAVELLGGFWRRTAAEAEKVTAAVSRVLLTDLDGSLGDLDDNFSPQALTGFDLPPIRGLRRDNEWAAPGIVAQLADRLGLASRRRIRSAAREDLVSALTHGSRQVVDRVLFDYDESKSAIEWRFCELLDSALQSAQAAAEFAQEAQAGGADGVARARHRIAQWSIKLEGITSRLD